MPTKGARLYPSIDYIDVDRSFGPKDTETVTGNMEFTMFSDICPSCGGCQQGARAPPALGAVPTAHIHFDIGSVY